MAEYQVIARKWRPQRFSDIVGQQHLVRTLKNAIREDRTAHAYLFVGPRGVGKTTTARIFAKALNCQAPEDGEPCCKCSSCQAIANESSIDVIEIDAASQNSVDNVRDLREEAMHVPASSRYKIYIIDEVHMLSKNAWNALLKTVEEPPPHVKFIFATTEVHMVLGTIISRCQRFDLLRIPSNLIAERLEQIAEAEKVNISPGAIGVIARAADGGMRDAQSLLDQMISFFGTGDGTEISEEQALALFGLSTAEENAALLKAVLSNDLCTTVRIIHELAEKGKNLETLFEELLVNLRSILICKIMRTPDEILDCGEEAVKRYRELGGNVRTDTLQGLLEQLSSVGRVLHEALNKQIYLESIIAKAMRAVHAPQISDLIARLNQLRGAGELEFVEQLPPVQTQMPTPGQPPAQIEGAASSPVKEQSRSEAPAVVKEPPEAEIQAPEPEAQETAPEPEIQKPVGQPQTKVREEKPNPRSLWHLMIAELDSHPQSDPVLKNYMQEAAEMEFDGSVLKIVWDEEFAAEHFARLKKNIELLHSLIQNVSGDWSSSVELEHREGVKSYHHDEPEEESQAVAQVPENAYAEEEKNERENGATPQEIPPEIREKVKNNKFVRKTCDLFDGRIVDIHG